MATGAILVMKQPPFSPSEQVPRIYDSSPVPMDFIGTGEFWITNYERVPAPGESEVLVSESVVVEAQAEGSWANNLNFRSKVRYPDYFELVVKDPDRDEVLDRYVLKGHAAWAHFRIPYWRRRQMMQARTKSRTRRLGRCR